MFVRVRVCADIFAFPWFGEGHGGRELAGVERNFRVQYN